MDGVRKYLAEEFSHLYVFNLRNDQCTSGERSRREGGKIFGSGSRTPVAITIMVKDPAHTGPCELRYYDIGDYLSREERLRRIEDSAALNAFRGNACARMLRAIGWSNATRHSLGSSHSATKMTRPSFESTRMAL